MAPPVQQYKKGVEGCPAHALKSKIFYFYLQRLTPANVGCAIKITPKIKKEV
jgi:hypothetical protein